MEYILNATITEIKTNIGNINTAYGTSDNGVKVSFDYPTDLFTVELNNIIHIEIFNNISDNYILDNHKNYDYVTIGKAFYYGNMIADGYNIISSGGLLLSLDKTIKTNDLSKKRLISYKKL